MCNSALQQPASVQPLAVSLVRNTFDFNEAFKCLVVGGGNAAYANDIFYCVCGHSVLVLSAGAVATSSCVVFHCFKTRKKTQQNNKARVGACDGGWCSLTQIMTNTCTHGFYKSWPCFQQVLSRLKRALAYYGGKRLSFYGEISFLFVHEV